MDLFDYKLALEKYSGKSVNDVIKLKAPEVLEGCFLLHIISRPEKVDIGFLIDILTYRK